MYTISDQKDTLYTKALLTRTEKEELKQKNSDVVGLLLYLQSAISPRVIHRDTFLIFFAEMESVHLVGNIRATRRGPKNAAITKVSYDAMVGERLASRNNYSL